MRRLLLAGLLVPGLLAPFVGALEREPVGEYRSRRARLAEALDGPAVLFAAPVNDLVEFQQEDNFYYLTGFSEPDAALVLDAEGGEHLFIPRRDPDEERWTGVRLGPGPEAERVIGVDSVEPLDTLDRRIRELVGDADEVFALTSDERSVGTLGELLPGVRVRSAAGALTDLRMVKAETEVALLRKAIDITMEAHREAAGVIAPGVFEYEVEGVLEYTFRRNGAERPAFPSIVGSGPFTTILHYDRNDRQMMDGDLVVVDIGAEYSGYAADVTRTYPVSGRFTDRQREIYQIVLDAQTAALERVRPGVAIGGPNGVHAAAARVIAEAGYAEYFIHGTSHYLGLYVHDVGSSGRPLEAGMVLTVEPGIYLPEEGLGVRIEDDVLVTADGYEMLSDFPREIAEIEALMARDR